jgi:hypothetical protein
MRILAFSAWLGATAIALAACGSSSNDASGSGGAAGGGGEADASDDSLADAGAEEAAAPFDTTLFDDVRITSDSSKPNFQQATVDVDFPAGPFASVTLVADLATTCYPFDGWKNDPPPSGQNWPADCDAFDRNWSFTLDDPKDATKDPPAIELIHAITPFGGPEHLEVDVTDAVNGLPGKHTMKVVIPTWSDSAGKVSGSNGGWNVTAKLHFVPGPAPRKVLAVIPLFAGQEDSTFTATPISFTVPPGTVDSRLEYRTSGHGGANWTSADGSACNGPAEEFCDRTHDIYVDEQKWKTIEPWIADCSPHCGNVLHYGPTSGGFDYCELNPCGDMNSVTAPRANWCPGSMTDPYLWDIDALKTPGDHTFRWTISRVDPGGTWLVSAVYFAFGG